MAFDRMQPIPFSARSSQPDQRADPPYRDEMISLTYRGTSEDGAPRSVSVHKVHRGGNWVELNPQWWKIEYVSSEGDLHLLRLRFSGYEFSDALKRGQQQERELDAAFQERGVVVVELDLAPGTCAADGNARDLAAIHLELI